MLLSSRFTPPQAAVQAGGRVPARISNSHKYHYYQPQARARHLMRHMHDEPVLAQPGRSQPAPVQWPGRGAPVRNMVK